MNSREMTLLVWVLIPLGVVAAAFIAWTVVTIVREYRWRTRDAHRLEEARRVGAAALAAHDREGAAR